MISHSIPPSCAHALERRPGHTLLPLASLPASSPLKGSTMNWDVIEGDWKQFKGHVKEKWGKLTDDNLDTIAGKRDQLAGTIQETYGITKDQAELQVKAFEQIHKDYQANLPT
jgi:uncharacterized protein YjbJ (UPF0337 family)